MGRSALKRMIATKAPKAVVKKVETPAAVEETVVALEELEIDLALYKDDEKEDLLKLKKSDLVALAKEEGISLDSTLTKPLMVEEILLSRQDG